MIFLNIFIDIILKAYFQTIDRERQFINDFELRKYQEAWSKFDNEGLGYMHVDDFPDLMLTLGKPFGWSEHYRGNKKKQDMYWNMICKNMMIYKDKRTYENRDMFRFNDLLDNLAVFYVAKD